MKNVIIKDTNIESIALLSMMKMLIFLSKIKISRALLSKIKILRALLSKIKLFHCIIIIEQGKMNYNPLPAIRNYREKYFPRGQYVQINYHYPAHMKYFSNLVNSK